MESLYTGSAATSDFKLALATYLEGRQSDRVKVESYVPTVKVRRLLTQLLHVEPQLEIDSVVIRGFSGCCDFVGSVDVHTSTGPAVFEFAWDCRWRAQAEGWSDCFGFPDQARAAQEYDWQCFRHWERRDG